MSELNPSPAMPTFGLAYAVVIYATSWKSAGSSALRAASPQVYQHPRKLQAVRDLVRACGKEMQAENLNAQVAAQVGVSLIRASCANRMMACPTPPTCC